MKRAFFPFVLLLLSCSSTKQSGGALGDSDKRNPTEDVQVFMDEGGSVQEEVSSPEACEEQDFEPIDVTTDVSDDAHLQDNVKGDAFETSSTDIPPSQGKIKVVPALIDFGYRQGNLEAQIPFSVLNVGTGALKLYKFSLEGDPQFSLIVGFDASNEEGKVVYRVQPPIMMKPGGEFKGKVSFLTNDSKPKHTLMRVFSDDPEYPDGFPVHILANQSVPCLDFTPDTVDFGAVVVGETNSADIRIEPCSDYSLAIMDVYLSTGASEKGFSLSFEKWPTGKKPTPSDPLFLNSGEKAILTVVYAPKEPSPVQDGVPVPSVVDLITTDNTFSDSSLMEIKGFAVEKKCAMPVIEVAEGTEVQAGTLLHLSGLRSFSPYGKITKYDWDVVEPQGNSGAFIPNDTYPDPTFFVGVPGQYQFYLRVDDEVSSGSCDPSTAIVNASASQVAVFVLSFVPEVPKQTDFPPFGPDVDLHFLHPNASGIDADGDGVPDRYYDVPWDCFWFNKTPNWDNPYPTDWWDDDPRLIYDSVDGLTPEVLVMGLQCPPNNVYRVGAHFFDDHGFGAAIVSFRAYVTGNLVAETQQRLLPLDLWDIADFYCGSRQVVLVTPISIKHNYQNPNFLVPQ
jgi:hypothetical protein